MLTKTSFIRGVAAAALAALGLAYAPTAAAAPLVPNTLTQQGRILDKDGEPVSSAVHFVFTVYDDAEASKPANVLWTEEQDITLEDGYFSTQLGSITELPEGLFDGSLRYLGVTVGSDDEMLPRQTVSSVPYALVAGTALVASSADFKSLSGIPAPCAAGQYLKGYSAAGAATCAALPALSCTVRTAFSSTAVTTVGCLAGEVMTGGGCNTTGYLQASYQNICVSNIVVIGSEGSGEIAPAAGPIFGLCQTGTGDDLWTCKTSAAASVRAFAHCCKVQ